MMVNNQPFWENKGSKKHPQISINRANLIKFWQAKGFRKYKMATGGYHLVRLMENTIVQPSSVEELTDTVKQAVKNHKFQEAILDTYLSWDYSSRRMLNAFDTLTIDEFNISTRDKAHFYYANGVVEVTTEGIKLIPYSEHKGYVWIGQVRDRNFELREDSGTSSVFNQFVENITNKDPLRYFQLSTSIGYLLHPYKDASFAKAIILIDEKLDFSGKAHGGTGKTLVSRAISEIVPVLNKDGKNLNAAHNRFFYQDLNPEHRVLLIDDVVQKFNFELLYSFITGDVSIEKKYQTAFSISFKESPKVLITSNYMVNGTGGDTDKRRRVEIEIAPYYSAKFQPVQEFGKLFFDDWNTEEWSEFDNLMLHFCKQYIACGIPEVYSENLNTNKLIQATDTCFADFAFDNLEEDVRYDKNELYNDYLNFCHLPKELLTKKTFKKWLDEYAEAAGLQAFHTKSNGSSYFLLKKMEE